MSPVFVVSYDIPHPSGTPTSQSPWELNQVPIWHTQHYLSVLSIDLEGFQWGSFWHLDSSVVVCHSVETKMAHSHWADKWHVKWMSKTCTLECANSCLTGTLFHGLQGNRVNCSNTIAEEARLVAVQDLPDLCVAHPSASNLSWMHAILNRVGGSPANSCRYCLCTLHTFSDFQYHFKIILHCSYDNHSTSISLTVLPFNKVAFF
jgi:hypothetical protein